MVLSSKLSARWREQIILFCPFCQFCSYRKSFLQKTNNNFSHLSVRNWTNKLRIRCTPIDPIQRQREHFVTTHQHQTAVFSAPSRSIVRHNCLNHHPYGTFYYSKKSGRTGRHFPSAGLQPVPPPRVPNSPVLNSHHHTVMAGGLFRSNNSASAQSNVR